MSDIRLSGLNSSYPSGTTAERPASSTIGALYFNTDLGVLQVYTPNGWFVYQNPATPTAPENVSATNQPSGRAYNNGQASVSFTPNSSGGTATLFTITPSPSTSPSTFTGNSSPIVVTNLQSSQQYTYTVTSNNLSGTSSASSASAGVTATTVPQAPTIDAVTAGDTLATVAYTAGATGGSAITGYSIVSNPATTTQTTSSTTYTFTGLTNDTAYTFAVTATNANGTSAASAASSAVTPSEPLITIGAYDSLATFTVPSGGITSVTFAGIPAGYKHLQLRYLVRGNRADETDDLRMRFNEDLGNNYSWHTIGGVSTNGSPYTYASANSNAIAHYEGIPATNSTADVFSATVCDILDYASTKNKTVRFIHGFNTNGDVKSLVAFNSGNWRNTGAINSITLSPIYGAGIVEHSNFALYGVR